MFKGVAREAYYPHYADKDRDGYHDSYVCTAINVRGHVVASNLHYDSMIDLKLGFL